MNASVDIDGRFVVALGAAVCGVILCLQLRHDSAERVLTRVVDACKEFAIAVQVNR